MKQELNRIKNDVETIKIAMGLPSSVGWDWIRWMKRDNWLNLWWCLPGVIIIASALFRFDSTERYLVLALAQWTGLGVSAAMLGISILYFRKMNSQDGRPDSLVREYKRINGMTRQGLGLNLALLSSLAFFFIWAKEFRVEFGAFWSGLFIFMGTSCLLTAVASRAYLLLGWAIPFLGYGLFQTVFHGDGKLSGISLGFMFIAVAMSFSIIQFWQIRRIESQYASH